MRSGWLIEQLPRTMQGSDVVRAFTSAGEDFADSVRGRMALVDGELDPYTASPEMLAYLAGWLGFGLDTHDDVPVMRRILRALGPVLRYRGTAWALGELARVVTGAAVRVIDPGCVVGPGENLPEESRLVRVELSDVGPLGLDRVRAVLEREIPVGVRLEIVTPQKGSPS